MTRITLHLPFPVSVNSIWRGGRKRVFKSAAYVKWVQQAGLEWLAQKAKQPKSIPAAFSAQLIVVRPDNRRRDVDNLLKCVLDFCKEHGIIQDDHLCEKLYVRWGSAKEAPLGARLILKPLGPSRKPHKN